MPKSDRKYVKSTLSSPYKRSPLLPITLTGDLTKSEIENDDVDKKKMKSKVLTPSRFDKVTPKKENREKAARKPSKFWSKGDYHTSPKKMKLIIIDSFRFLQKKNLSFCVLNYVIVSRTCKHYTIILVKSIAIKCRYVLNPLSSFSDGFKSLITSFECRLDQYEA